MTNQEKLAFIGKLHNELLALAEEKGDPHPLVAISLIDTDPLPMPGPYVQASLSFRLLLPAAEPTLSTESLQQLDASLRLSTSKKVQ